MGTVLFSPVGSADPVTGLGDGPMLHIIRHYRPDVITLLLSPTMAEYEVRDQRYTDAIGRVADWVRAEGDEYEPTIRIVNSGTEEVHRHDLHIREFAQCVRELHAEFQEAQILLNISSGTPGMQHALVAIDAFGTPSTTAVQVPSPRGAINQRGDREDPATYDLDLAWELNPDNASDAVNRCLEVASPHFGALLQRQNVKRLVMAYDYAAAARLAGDGALPGEAVGLIEGAVSRVALDHVSAAPRFRGTVFRYDPADRLKEYVQALEVLVAREQWAEFAVRCTPAITETLRAVLRPHLSEDAYTKRGSGGSRLDRAKVNGDTELAGALELRPGSNSPYVTNKNLIDLVQAFCPSEDIKRQMRTLRTFEEGVRNHLAHEIGRTDKRSIQDRGRCSPEEVMEILRKHSGADPGLYAKINEEIRGLIDGAALHQ